MMKSEKRHITILILLFLVVLFVVAISWMDIPPENARNDNAEYLMFAYNLTHHGVFSHETGIVNGRQYLPSPTAYREPVYPLVLSIGMLLSPSYRNLDMKDFLVAERTVLTKLEVKPPNKFLAFIDLSVLLICAFLSALIIYRKTGNARFSAYSLFFIGLSPKLVQRVGDYNSEVFSALLILGLSLSLYYLIEKQRPINYCVSGFLLGILTLTKAIFQYAFLPITVFMIIYQISKKAPAKHILVTTLVFLLSFGAVVGPWVVRNHSHFDRFYITDRGGEVLYIRSLYLDMTPKQYLASFVWFCDHSTTDRLKPLFDKDVQEYFNERFSTDYVLKNRVTSWNTLKTLDFDHSKRDANLMNSSFDKIKAHPFRYLLTCIPFAWRGLFVGEVRFISLIIFGGFFAATIQAIRRREWAWGAFFSIAVYLYGINTLVTHNLGRYNRPLIPIIWIACFFLMEPVYTRVEKRLMKSSWFKRLSRD